MIERRTSPYFATLHTGYGQTPRQAAALQIEMARQVIRVDDLDCPTTVTGVDMGFEAGGTIARAAAVTLSFPELTWIESAVARGQTTFPYIPGLLSFRELPLLLQALGQLERRPQLLLCDGQGYAHPRRFGIACHLGVVTGLPSIGVGKSRLIGTHREPGPKRGSRAALRDGGEIVGTVLRTRDGVRAVYVSVGHRVSLATATALVLQCAPKYRLPEPIREADRLASARY